MSRSAHADRRLRFESLENRRLLTALPWPGLAPVAAADHAEVASPLVKHPVLTGTEFTGSAHSYGYPLTPITVTFLTQHGKTFSGVFTMTEQGTSKVDTYTFTDRSKRGRQTRSR